MNHVVAASAALVVAGPAGLVLAVCVMLAIRVRQARRRPRVTLRPILMALLVELRSGRSVLSALHTVSERFPVATDIAAAARVASVVGLAAATEATSGELRIVFSHLARSSTAGTSAADAVRRLLESDMARERARRLARARSLPIRLMLPVSLLVLPGVILLTYGPTVLSLLGGLITPFR